MIFYLVDIFYESLEINNKFLKEANVSSTGTVFYANLLFLLNSDYSFKN